MCYGTILSASLMRAAKTHKCRQCLRVIGEGERYWKQVGKYEDGEFYLSKLCEACHATLSIDADDEAGCYARDFGLDETKSLARNFGWRSILKRLRAFRAAISKPPRAPSALGTTREEGV